MEDGEKLLKQGGRFGEKQAIDDENTPIEKRREDMENIFKKKLND